ncbi:hypothetical protein PIB30_082553 [Stylosanthes scabra]|uniref:Uncharacterized protein n=1 Tax=Stylosanthes scabra TaxID=79078 RepID=A0ABU6XTV6_9FABA|nr:hypothetical protein [Stylosanthes scabra]
MIIKASVSKSWRKLTCTIKDTLHGNLHPTNIILLDTTHTNLMDMVVHECLEEVEEENEDKEAEDVDQEVEDKDKEPKGMEIVHSASSEVTPPKLPSELHFKWVNPFYMNFLGPQHYCLLETDNQLKALCGVLDKKEVDFGWLKDSRCIMGGVIKLEAQNGEIPHKFPSYIIYAKRRNLRKHLESWPFQEKRDDQQGEGWTNRVWDPGKSFMNRHFWGVIACIGAFKGLLNINWDPLGPKKSKHWWGFNDEFKHKPP